MKVMIHLSPEGGNLLVVRQNESHGGGRMVRLVFDGFRALTDGIFCDVKMKSMTRQVVKCHLLETLRWLHQDWNHRGSHEAGHYPRVKC